MIDIKLLKKYAKNGYNVMFSGPHGVGKSTIVIEIFNELFPGKWVYFSGATMDPFMDLIGIPKEVERDGKRYIEFIRPENIPDDIEAVFIDEYNRAPKRVRNATMELLQMKSINGRKYENLKIVWAAENPLSEGLFYDVEETDPAQKDRFHIHITIPNEVDTQYFQKKYNNMGTAAASWAKALPDNKKVLISPRRLDYALDIYTKFQSLSNVFDPRIDCNELENILSESFHVGILDGYVSRLNSSTISLNEIEELQDDYAAKYSDSMKLNKIIRLLSNNEKYIPIVAFLCDDEQASAIQSSMTELVKSAYIDFTNKSSLVKEIGISVSKFNFLGMLTEGIANYRHLKPYMSSNIMSHHLFDGDSPVKELTSDFIANVNTINDLFITSKMFNDHVALVKDVTLFNLLTYVHRRQRLIDNPGLYDMGQFEFIKLNSYPKQKRVYTNRGLHSWMINVVNDVILDLGIELDSQTITKMFSDISANLVLSDLIYDAKFN